MTNANETPPTPPGRTPGKYVVYVMVVFWVLVFGGSLVLALRLQPAADRYHNPPPATKNP